MPISNSCSRSTTSMGNILNSSGDSFLEKAFWNKWTPTSAVYQERCTYCHWDQRVIFEEPLYGHTINHVVVLIYGLTCSFKMTMPIWVINTCERHMLQQVSMHSHVRNMVHWYETPRTRAATKILNASYNYSSRTYSKSLIFQQQSSENLLFHVICRISEYTRVKTSRNLVTTLDHYSMLVCFQEFIIEYDWPLCVVHFLTTMTHERGVGFLSMANVVSCKDLEGIRKLSVPKEVSFLWYLIQEVSLAVSK